MIYFISSFILAVYFELFGRWLAYKFKIKQQMYFPLGFIAVLAFVYPSLVLTINNLSFYLILVLYSLFVIISLFFIIKDIKRIDRSINPIYIFLILLISTILTVYSVNTSLGNLHGFDSLYYLNFTVNNIGKNVMNNFGIYLNGQVESSFSYYSGQTYYYLAGVIIFIFGKFFSFLGIEYFYGTAFIWIFQILYFLILGGLICEAIDYSKNKHLIIVPILFDIFLFGKLYYNNVYGFFGNSLLTLVVSYSVCYLLRFFESKKDSYKYLIYMSLLAGCSLSSSGIYILFFFLFAFYFFNCNKKGLLKEYSAIVLLPIINAISMERYSSLIIYGASILLSIFLYIFDSCSYELSKKKNYIYFILIGCFSLTFLLSRFCSNGLFDFHGFLDNLSQKSDMTLDYFHIYNKNNLENIYKFFCIQLLVLVLFKEHNKPLIKFFWILIIVFFNPFSCNAISEVIKVYYRAYSIIINPFSIIILYDILINEVSKNAYKYIISIILLIIITVNVDFSNPLYYHYEHIPCNDYNSLYKMSNDQFDIIRELKYDIDYFENDSPYIITGNLLTQCMIPRGKYLYGRNYIKSKYWKNSETKLYEIFYTPEFLGDSLCDNPDYDNMLKYIKESEIDYIVVDKNVEIFDSNKNDYSYLFYKVNEICNIYPIYENDTYVLYHFEN